MIATSGFLTALECTNSFLAGALPRTPLGGLQRSPDPMTGLSSPILLRGRGKGGRGKGKKKIEEGNGRDCPPSQIPGSAPVYKKLFCVELYTELGANCRCSGQKWNDLITALNVISLNVISFCRFHVAASADKPYTSIIHRMWKTSSVPLRWRQSAESCFNANSDFVFCHWTDDELTQFLADRFSWFFPTYLAYPNNIQRSDIARYLLLYHYGGTYVDLDVVCRSSMATVFSSAPAEARVVALPARPWGISNSFMAVRWPREQSLRAVISGLRHAANSRWYPPLPYADAILRTGPIYLTMSVRCRSTILIFLLSPLNSSQYTRLLSVNFSVVNKWLFRRLQNKN